MILKAEEIAKMLTPQANRKDPLVITPLPDLKEMKESGSASIDLRLGTWFLKLQETKAAILSPQESNPASGHEVQLTQLSYVRFGGKFVLHPRSFVLGATLEWVRFPANLAGYVIGKSSWGRYGLIIATAIGVHPGFTGCLTLELSNVGEMPIQLSPGVKVCQLFLHALKKSQDAVDKTSFVGHRRPILGQVKVDEVARKLSAPL